MFQQPSRNRVKVLSGRNVLPFHQMKCDQCDTDYSYNASDIKKHFHPRDQMTAYSVDCPHCKSCNVIKEFSAIEKEYLHAISSQFNKNILLESLQHCHWNDKDNFDMDYRTDFSRIELPIHRILCMHCKESSDFNATNMQLLWKDCPKNMDDCCLVVRCPNCDGVVPLTAYIKNVDYHREFKLAAKAGLNSYPIDRITNKKYNLFTKREVPNPVIAPVVEDKPSVFDKNLLFFMGLFTAILFLITLILGLIYMI